MMLTKHAHARFKQRQKVKNEGEMMRRFSLAVKRGTLLSTESTSPKTLCYLFAGYKYIVSEDLETLITLFPAKKPSDITKRRLLDTWRMRQYASEVNLCLLAIK